MQKKIIGIFLIIQLIITILLTSSAIANINQDHYIEDSANNKYIIFGLMSQIDDPYSEFLDFEINRFALIFGDGQIQRLNAGEMIRLHGSNFGIKTNNIFIGIITDWSIIG